MINLLIKNFYILSSNFRNKLFLFYIFLLLTIFFESISIILLFQSVNIFLNSSNITAESNYLYKTFMFVGIDIINKKDFLFIIVAILYLFKTCFLTFFSWWRNKFLQEMRKNIGERLYTKYMFESHSYHLSKNTSELIRNITLDNLTFTFSVLQSLFLVTEILVIFFLGAILFYLQPVVTALVCLTFLFFIIIWYISLKKKLRYWGHNRQFYDGKVLKFLNEGFFGHKEIKILGVENFFIKHFNFNLIKSTRSTLYSDFVTELPRIWLEFLLVISFCAIFTFLLIFQELSFLTIAPLLAAYTGAALRLIPSINRVIVATNILNVSNSVTNLFSQELKNEKQEISLINESKQKLKFDKVISFQNIYFSYSNDTPEIFNNFNYQIKKNEIIGIVGPSGSGKSTFANLLMGIHFPNQGKIKIDDIILERSNRRKWQNKIGYVPQNIFLSDDSIEKNIALGEEKHQIDVKKVEKLILDCQLSNFVSKLKLKKESNIGELGSKISEGQKQRLGIARALYKDPDILILDEFTSSLDLTTENEIMEIIKKLKEKKTIFIVSHRQNAIKYCDKIINLIDLKKVN